MNYFTTQKDFFQKLDIEKYSNFENNLCWLINIFILLKNIWINISEKEIFEKSLEINAFDENIWWKYDWLIELFNFYINNLLYNKLKKNIIMKVFSSRFFHNYKLKKIFNNFENNIYIASVKFWENHLIIIEKTDKNFIYYKSIWTKYKIAKNNWKMRLDIFFEIYNKRWILITKLKKKN